MSRLSAYTNLKLVQSGHFSLFTTFLKYHYSLTKATLWATTIAAVSVRSRVFPNDTGT